MPEEITSIADPIEETTEEVKVETPIEEEFVPPVLEKDDDTKSEDSEDKEEFDPYDSEKAKTYIQKQTEKAYAPIKEQIFKDKVESKLNAILSENPEYSPYADKIKKWVTHENRMSLIKSGLPVKTVVLEAIAPYLEKIGAEKIKQADSEADQSKSAGITTLPKESNSNPYAGMSNKEIENIAEQVKSGRYNT